MRILLAAEAWPHPPTAPADVAALVERAWDEAEPGHEVEAVAVSDGSPRMADALTGEAVAVAGVEAVAVGGALVLAPAGGAPRWDVTALALALRDLAILHAAGDVDGTVVVPLGDVPPAGDATELWAGDLGPARAALSALPVIALVGSDRPLLGMAGMAAATVEGREHDAALAAAAQDQEERWRAHARVADPLAGKDLLGVSGAGRLSDRPGAGAAGGLAYALAALGARLEPAAPRAFDICGAAAVAAGADLVVAVCADGGPAGMDRGVAAAAAAAAGRTGVPCVVIAPEVGVGRRDLMAAGVAGAYGAGEGLDALADQVRRVAHTWARTGA